MIGWWLGSLAVGDRDNDTTRDKMVMTQSAACVSDVRFAISHFTGKERDSESGNDYFGARYYASTMGRFLSPDPIRISSAHLENPQRWNEYAYGLNNPLINVDIDGRFSTDGRVAHVRIWGAPYLEEMWEGRVV